jgi:hypothetical protein
MPSSEGVVSVARPLLICCQIVVVGLPTRRRLCTRPFGFRFPDRCREKCGDRAHDLVLNLEYAGCYRRTQERGNTMQCVTTGQASNADRTSPVRRHRQELLVDGMVARYVHGQAQSMPHPARQCSGAKLGRGCHQHKSDKRER